ncbi:MAG: hypothetical protein GFH27_549305n75 [Chloroflexi bacterium AL-W]|nr:hypothetical protein [Chloroflexi bacterium AL-N1]NOK69321.1 hypothetical protein [Chloroflexi bacterium AL-N10]NOK76382.1 hypothetical protein [Chloroflexi bacterium AL-N5]NOK83499.1 hypothetical protein [Chloroflexi bacterium AL-W]NOK91159.1 hypothetical protein [Chloroflexi bacterium AL-N15]
MLILRQNTVCQLIYVVALYSISVVMTTCHSNGGQTEQSVLPRTIPTTIVHLANMKIGWCLASPTFAEPTLTTVDRVDCEMPHLVEVFALVDRQETMTAPYPGTTAVQEFLRDTCDQAYEEQFQVASIDHGLGIAILAPPTESFWLQSDGMIRCGVFPLTLKAEAGPFLKCYQSET